MAIVIKADTAGISKALLWAAAMRGSLNRNLAMGMQRAGYEARDELRRVTPGYLSNPTNYTLRGTFSSRVDANKLLLRVGFMDMATKAVPAARYLQPQVAGGPRSAKSHERQLQRAGLLRPGQFLVPTNTFPLTFNSHGNLTGGQYTQVLSRLKALGQQGYMGNASNSSRSRAKRGGEAGRDFFMAAPSGRLGVQARVGALPAGTGGKGSKRGGRPVTSNLKRGFHTAFLITKAPRYQRRFPVETIVLNKFLQQFPRKFTEAAIKSLGKK